MKGEIQTDAVLQDLNLALSTFLILDGWGLHYHDICTKGQEVVRLYVLWHESDNFYAIHILIPIIGGKHRLLRVESPPDIDTDLLLAKIAEVK